MEDDSGKCSDHIFNDEDFSDLITLFEDIEDDLDFCQKLLTEQNCFVFPSSLFGSPDGFRIILCTQPETLIEFGDRLEEFCKVHVRKSERKQNTQ